MRKELALPIKKNEPGDAHRLLCAAALCRRTQKAKDRHQAYKGKQERDEIYTASIDNGSQSILAFPFLPPIFRSSSMECIVACPDRRMRHMAESGSCDGKRVKRCFCSGRLAILITNGPGVAGLGA